MVKLSKRISSIDKKINQINAYQVSDALSLVRENATARFNESVDIAVQLGVNVRKSDQIIRGSVVLPFGKGKQVRVAVFTQGEEVGLVKDAGADFVGLEDLANDIRSNGVNFDVVIASPDTMSVVEKLGQILGPRGMMPNAKMGTVSNDLVNAVKKVKSGQIQYRTDKAGIIHASIGRASFNNEQLKSNLLALIDSLKKSRPASFKGVYLKKIILSSTMGRGIRVELSSSELL